MGNYLDKFTVKIYDIGMHIRGENGQHLFVIKKDELLVQSLTLLVSENRIPGGALSGLGALKNVELGYYDLEKKDYIRKVFSSDDYELISLTGNISLRDGKPYVHVHAALGNREFQVFGGHLFEATVAVTAEISVLPLGIMPERVLDSCLGLATLSKRADKW